MKFFEGFGGKKVEYAVTDYEDEVFYDLLLKLPKEIALNCITKIEDQGLNDDEAFEYLEEVTERRREATTESIISDSYIESFFTPEAKDAIYRDIETTVFTDSQNHLGAGMTARIKGYELQKGDESIKSAIKYVVTPTEKTLTASGEHDVIAEVERIEEVEKLEMPHMRRSKYIRVPHPFFYHKTDKIQCYGMELIDGANLKEIIKGTARASVIDILKDSPLLHMDRNELFVYVERFFNTMHEYCLHGDIKPANIMLSTEGVLYVIDFGQSILANSETEKTSDQFSVLKEDEINGAKQSILQALNALRGVE